MVDKGSVLNPQKEFQETCFYSTELYSDNLINIQIHGFQNYALCDTGAEISLISAEFVNQVPELKASLLSSEVTNVKIGDGSTVNILGKVKTYLTIGKQKFKIKLHVMQGLLHNVVLGIDFMQKYEVQINIAKKQFKVKIPNTCDLLTLEKITIPPKSEIVTFAKISKPLPNKVIGECISLQNTDYVLAKSVSTVNNESTPVRIMNPWDAKITIKKGKKIGKFVCLSSKSDILPMEKDNNISKPFNPPSNPPTSNANMEFNFDESILTESQQNDLSKLLHEFDDCFVDKSGQLGKTDVVKHKIEIEENTAPIRHRAYRVPPYKRQEIEKQVDSLLKQELIKPSVSPWAAPVVLIKKSDGSFRFCVDYRSLNKVTKFDAYPIPLITDYLDNIGGTANGRGPSKYFSTCDLQSGFYQIEMESESMEKTAFICHKGLYEWTRMPMGLKNSPSTFQRVMNFVLSGLSWYNCLIYIDDLIVFSPDFETHLKDLRAVFERLRSFNLKLKPSKCLFGCRSVRYLGFIVSENGIAADPDKIKGITNFPTPSNLKQLRAFLGVTSFYRRFIKGYSKIAKPLYHLTQKDVPFIFDEDCNKAFSDLKESLTQAPILAYPDFKQPFIVYCDASKGGLGAILAQKSPVDGKERVISYAARTLSKAESNYCITDLEGLGLIFAVKQFKHYLEYSRFVVVTDHISLKYILTKNDLTSGRRARWAIFLQGFDFDIQYKPGKRMSHVDGLSRQFDKSDNEDKTSSNLEVQQVNAIGLNELDPMNTDIYREKQNKDPYLRSIKKYLLDGILPSKDKIARTILLQAGDYIIKEGLLYHIWRKKLAGSHNIELVHQLAVPESMQELILQQCHDAITAGHLGFNKTLERIRAQYHWPGMNNHILNWVTSCNQCNGRKVKKNKRAPLLPLPVPEGLFHITALDIQGPFKTSNAGNKYIVVFSDYLTRWPEAFPVANISSEVIADLLYNNIICRYGPPHILITDRGSNLIGELMTNLSRMFGIQRNLTSSYHPQSDGVVERFNGVLSSMMAAYVDSNQLNWDQIINPLLWAYRSVAHSSHGFPPYLLMFGRYPGDVFETVVKRPQKLSPSVQTHLESILEKLDEAESLVKNNLEMNRAKMKALHDRKHAVSDKQFKVGDICYVYIPKAKVGLSRKLLWNYHGPYLISSFANPVGVRLRRLSDNVLTKNVYHLNRLKKVAERKRPPDIIPPEDFHDDDSNDDDQFDVDVDDLPKDSFSKEPLEEHKKDLSEKDHDDHLKEDPAHSTDIETVAEDSNEKKGKDSRQNEEEAKEEDTEDEKEDGKNANDKNAYYKIDKILHMKYGKRGKRQYYVSWEGYSDKHNQYVPYQNLSDDMKKYVDTHDIEIHGRIPKSVKRKQEKSNKN